MRSPLFIAAMTGGHPETLQINAVLADAAEHYGLGMGVGSQRAALENPALENSFSVVREHATLRHSSCKPRAVQLRDAWHRVGRPCR